MTSRLTLGCAALLVAACQAPPAGDQRLVGAVTAAFATEAVGSDPDDPAIWVHPTDPALSLIVGTDKEAAPLGGLVVYDVQGRIVQQIRPLDRPNNVDIRQRVRLGPDRVEDIAVVTERYQHRLRVYRIDPVTRKLEEFGAIPVFEGETGEAAEPMGVALYVRPSDGAAFAIVGRKTGPAEGYLWQYRLSMSGGSVVGSKERAFGRYSGKKEIEAIAVDDELGFVYYSDETVGVRKYFADPDQESHEIGLIATNFRGDHEGIAIYRGANGTGYLICTDQLAANSEYHVYQREGVNQELGVFSGRADTTDGIEVTSSPLLPDGLFVAMNSGPKNFLAYRWRDIAEALRLPQ